MPILVGPTKSGSYVSPTNTASLASASSAASAAVKISGRGLRYPTSTEVTTASKASAMPMAAR